MIRTGLIWSTILIAAMVGISVYGWINLPEESLIPRHWDLQGNVTGYSSRNMILIGMPVIAVFTTFIIAIVPLIDPRKENLQKSAPFYLSAWIGGLGLLAVVHGSIIHAAVTKTEPSLGVVFAVVGLMYLAMGNFMAKSKSNWFAGIRTPWSLSSENAWQASNRTGGWLLAVTGVATIIATFTLPPTGIVSVMAGGSMLAIGIAVIVSYIAWRNDPARQTKSPTEEA